jgi:hypothetical protein
MNGVAMLLAIDWTINASSIGSAFIIIAGVLIQAAKLEALVRSHADLLRDHAIMLDRHQHEIERIPLIEERTLRSEQANHQQAVQIGGLEVAHATLKSAHDVRTHCQ